MDSSNYPRCAERDCTSRCVSAQHAHQLINAVTKGTMQQIMLYLSRCHNAAVIRDSLGRTVLHVAASCGCSQLIIELLSDGSDLNIQDLESGWTALHRSLFYGHLTTARHLIAVCTQHAILYTLWFSNLFMLIYCAFCYSVFPVSCLCLLCYAVTISCFSVIYWHDIGSFSQTGVYSLLWLLILKLLRLSCCPFLYMSVFICVVIFTEKLVGRHSLVFFAHIMCVILISMYQCPTVSAFQLSVVVIELDMMRQRMLLLLGHVNARRVGIW
jgi:hypothetical protein